MSNVFWTLLIGFACYAGFGLALLYLVLRSERHIAALAEQLRPREPGTRRGGIVVRLPRRDDWESLEGEV